jgi:hypothetical protein
MRLRFTIRDLLWLTALLAMGLAWWVIGSSPDRMMRLNLRRFLS